MDYFCRACFIRKYNRRRKRLNNAGSLGRQKVSEHKALQNVAIYFQDFSDDTKKKQEFCVLFRVEIDISTSMRATQAKRKNIINI